MPSWLIVVILMLFNCAAMLSVINVDISAYVRENSENNPFRSLEVYETFIRVVSVVALVVMSFIQSLFYRFLMVSLLKVERFSVLRSWLALLVGNVPFMLMAFLGLLPFFPLTSQVLSELWVRIPLGIASVLIYSGIVSRWVLIGVQTGALFIGIASCVNALLLLLGSSLV